MSIDFRTATIDAAAQHPVRLNPLMISEYYVAKQAIADAARSAGGDGTIRITERQQHALGLADEYKTRVMLALVRIVPELREQPYREDYVFTMPMLLEELTHRLPHLEIEHCEAFSWEVIGNALEAIGHDVEERDDGNEGWVAIA